MRILTRYILKEVISHSLLGLVIFTFVIYIPYIGRLLELAARHELSTASVIFLLLAPVPGILVLTVPMSVLVGTLIGLSRMAADGEVIAARAAGIALGQFVRPVVIFAFLGWGLTSLMSLVLAPQASLKLSRMEAQLKTSQAPYEIQPRVFIEQFPNLLIYLEDVSGSRNRWKGVFIVDSTQRDAPTVTLAERGILVNDPSSGGLTLHLEGGTTHETDPQHAERYSVVSFTATDIPILGASSDTQGPEHRAPGVQSLRELLASLQPRPAGVPPGRGLGTSGQPSAGSPGADERRAALVELNYRLALPVASLVLAWVGIPLGLATRKGGKPVGVMLTLLAVFVYYVIMAFGLSLAKQGRLNPTVGLWSANVILASLGLLMMARLRRVRMRLQSLLEWLEGGAQRFERWRQRRARPAPESTFLHPRSPGNRIFQILDVYVIRGWAFYFVVLLVAFVGIYIVFDFFQILSDVVRNHAGARLVFNYYRYFSPQILYTMVPLSILVATLVNFSILTKTNQVIAIKSAGISLYRISLPVLFVAALLSAGMFVLGDEYLPATNQRQDALRNQIKGRPAQTHYRPDRQWIFGESSRIYNYRFFDPDRNLFAELSVFEFGPPGFQLTRRIYAARAFWEPHINGWVLENGWTRDLALDKVTAYMPFAVATFRELTEKPAYFKKEVRPSEQMSAFELGRYIDELSQSGFDVVRLSVQLYRKFSYPLITFVVALIAIPFSFSMGRQGALSSVALSIGIAILYWSTSSLFEAMGNLSQLPPAVAAWAPDVLFGLGGVFLLLRVRT
jgi:LPS export ABC transporter permease LptG/LPS export ABC transporter permease LptF